MPSPAGSTWTWTCHWTPVCAPGTAEAPPARRRDRGQFARDGARERGQRHDRGVGRRLRGRRAEQRVERLEDDVGRGDQPDAGDAEGQRPGAGPRSHRDGVADPRLQRGGELLVEHDRPGSEAP